MSGRRFSERDVVKKEPVEENEETYPLRNQRMGRYMTLVVPDTDDSLLYCAECGVEYPSDCPVHGPLLVVEDKKVPQDVKQNDDPNYCYLTLPDSLEIKPSRIDNAGMGVFATTHLAARTRFGPYKGTDEKNEDLAHTSGYCWQLYQDGKPSHFVDARDPCHSNWMRFANCARREDEQSLTAYQQKGEIYYRAHRDIPPGTELLIYYGDSYAEELNIPIQKVGNFECQDKTRLDDVYLCIKCRLSFSTDVFLKRHLHRFHDDFDWKWKDETQKDDNNNSCQSSREENSNGIESHGERSCVKQEVTTYGVCGEQVYERSSLQDHVEGHSCNLESDTGERSFKCFFCSKTSIDMQALQAHLRSHAGDKPYICSVCGKAFRYKGHLRGHMRIHTGNRPHKCDVCSKAFFERYSLQRHMTIHPGEKPYKCDVCSKAFRCRRSMLEHRRIHTGEIPYKCSVCGKAFFLFSQMKVHMRIHTKEKPHKCDVCSKAFKYRRSLREHMRIHTEEKHHKCHVCSKAFWYSRSLQEHIRIHTGERPHKCSVCSKAFFSSGNLQEHIRTHTGEKPYKCSVCSKAFISGGNLQVHMRIHTGEKPYKCSLCSKAFRQKSTLQVHMGNHTGDKPHKCDVCSKAFCQNSRLRRHMKIHTGEKPYKCSSCNQEFIESSDLKRHTRIHTRKKL